MRRCNWNGCFWLSVCRNKKRMIANQYEILPYKIIKIILKGFTD